MGTVHGLYEATPPTLTDGLAHGLQLDTNGNLKTVSAGTGATADKVQGNSAAGATDTGNPVKVGAVFNTTPPTLTNGQRGDIQLDSVGNVKVVGGSPTGAAAPSAALLIGLNNNGNTSQLNAAASTGDNSGGSATAAVSLNLYNNTGNYDRAQNNIAVTLLASASRTTTQTSADLVNYNGLSFLDVILDVTSAGTGSITLTINGKDPASGKYYLLLSGAAVITVVTNRYRVSPYIALSANAIAQDVVPRIFQIVVTANNANPVTYSVGYNLSRGV